MATTRYMGIPHLYPQEPHALHNTNWTIGM